MTDTLKIRKQLIDSLIQNFNYETNPNWNDQLWDIHRQVKAYWQELDRQQHSKNYDQNNPFPQ